MIRRIFPLLILILSVAAYATAPRIVIEQAPDGQWAVVEQPATQPSTQPVPVEPPVVVVPPTPKPPLPHVDPPPPVNDIGGWTPVEVRAGAVTIYVDAQGNDSRDGLTPATAMKTPEVAFRKLRGGKGDVLRLERGDTFPEGRVWVDKSDVWITSYGDDAKPRPVLLTGTAAAVEYASTNTIRDVRIIGIAARCYLRDDADPRFNPDAALNYGFRFHCKVERMLIEDCYLEGFAQGIAFIERTGRNVVIRRNVIVDSWDRGMTRQADGSYKFDRQRKGQAIYLEWCPGTVIEENVIDNAGQHPQHCPGTMHGHGIYVQGKDPAAITIIRGNVIANAASDAFQARESAEVYGNLILNCPVVGLIGGDRGVFRDNLIMGSATVAAGKDRASGWGFALESASGIIQGNTFAYKPVGVAAEPAIKLSAKRKTTVTVAGNSVADWAGMPLKVEYTTQTLIETGNSWQDGPKREPAPIDVAAFMGEARKQRKGSWRAAYTAAGVIGGKAGN